MGGYSHNLPFSSLEANQRHAIPNDLAGLVGRRLVTSSETNEGIQLNEARVKMLVGQDPVTARFLYHDYFTFVPVAHCWLAVNYKPVVRDASEGFWRRVRMVPFDQVFKLDHEPRRDCLPDHRHGDKDLSGRLWDEEQEGILAWVVDGAVRWQLEGLEAPSRVKALTQAYREESDVIARFLDECCTLQPGLRVAAGALYLAFRAWAAGEGIDDAPSATAFGTRISGMYEKAKNTAGSFYRGLSLGAPGGSE